MVMTPVMYLLSGTLRESPQRTHFWNNTKLAPDEVAPLHRDMMVQSGGVGGESSRRVSRLPLFHMPVFGGWKNYIVLEPQDARQPWHVGWIAEDVAGVSRLSFTGPVRVLEGPGAVQFFGVSSDEQSQVAIRKLAQGRIGDGGPFAHMPLL